MSSRRSAWEKRVLSGKREEIPWFRFLDYRPPKPRLSRAERQSKRERQHRRNRILTLVGSAVAVVLVAALTVRIVLLMSGHVSAKPGSVGELTTANAQGTGITLAQGNLPAHGQTVNGMDCYSDEVTLFHIHTSLIIYAHGKQMTLPAGIGFVEPKSSGMPALAYDGSSVCIYQVHTHYTDNQIHVEAPFKVKYTLGDFFALWGEPLSATQVAGYQKDATHPLAFQVSDPTTQALHFYTGDPNAIPLVDGETIVVLYDSIAVAPR